MKPPSWLPRALIILSLSVAAATVLWIQVDSTVAKVALTVCLMMLAAGLIIAPSGE